MGDALRAIEQKDVARSCRECNILFPSRRRLREHNAEAHGIPLVKEPLRAGLGNYQAKESPAKEAPGPERSVLVAQVTDAVRKELSPLTELLATTLQKLEGAAAAMQQGGGHPAGLCQDTACETCVQQAQQIRDAVYQQAGADAYRRGQEDAANSIEQSLVLAGGEGLRERVAQAVQQGQAVRQQQERENHAVQVVR